MRLDEGGKYPFNTPAVDRFPPQPEEEKSVDPEHTAEVERLGEAVKGELRRLVQERFGKEGKEALDYHGPEHSLGVAEDAVDLLKIIQQQDPSMVSDVDVLLVELEALAHDLVLESNTEGFTRARDRGAAYTDEVGELKGVGEKVGNEGKSAQELLKILKKTTTSGGKEFFPTWDPEFRAGVAADIAATYPDALFYSQPDPNTGLDGLKISQPHLTSESSLRAWALATADLRGVYRKDKNPKGFIEHGDAELRESKVGIRKEIATGLDSIPPEKRVVIVKEILGWKHTQINFPKWQEKLFLQSVAEQAKFNGKPQLQELLKSQFDFAPAIALAQSESVRLKTEYGSLVEDATDTKKFQALLQEVGYEV